MYRVDINSIPPWLQIATLLIILVFYIIKSVRGKRATQNIGSAVLKALEKGEFGRAKLKKEDE